MFPSAGWKFGRVGSVADLDAAFGVAGEGNDDGHAPSEGAVNARELGLPAVMAIRGVMQRLRNGQRVRVDGSAGTVSLLPH